MRGRLVGTVALFGVTAACGRVAFDPLADSNGIPDGTRDAKLDVGYCARLPALGADPTLDGIVEAGLVLETLAPVGWQSSLDPLPPVPDVPVRYAIAYRPDGLYFYVEVADPGRFPARAQDFAYCGDGIELYVDHDGVLTDLPMFDASGAVQFIARAPADEVTARSDGEYYVRRALVATWSTGFVAIPRTGGYTVEAVIDAPAMLLGSWTLARGERVGLDFGLNISPIDGSTVPLSECPQGTRLGQFFLRIDESMASVYGGGAPYWTPTAYCTPVLD